MGACGCGNLVLYVVRHPLTGVVFVGVTHREGCACGRARRTVEVACDRDTLAAELFGKVQEACGFCNCDTLDLSHVSGEVTRFRLTVLARQLMDTH